MCYHNRGESTTTLLSESISKINFITTSHSLAPFENNQKMLLIILVILYWKRQVLSSESIDRVQSIYYKPKTLLNNGESNMQISDRE